MVEIMEVWVKKCGIGTAYAGYAGMYQMGSEVDNVSVAAVLCKIS
jgi:hypothetical protein